MLDQLLPIVFVFVLVILPIVGVAVKMSGGSRVTWPSRRLAHLMTAVALIFAVGALPTGALASTPFRLAAATAPSLGSAQSFAVLGGTTVTNTGSTVVTGDLGVSPGSAVTGFPPGIVTGGSMHVADAVALQAQNAVTTAFNNLAGQPCTGNLTGQDLGGLTLTSGVYCFSSSAQLTGMLTLDAQGSANAVFIFQIGSTLTTASSSSVRVINGGSNCNVYWQVGSSATLGTGTSFVGSIFALTSITLTNGATVSGRALARNGAVTMDANTVSASACTSSTPSSTATAGPVSPTAGPSKTPTSCVGNIHGSKIDGAGHGLAGWTIQLLQGNEVVQSATTDASGNFNFLGLGMGAFTLQEVQQTGWVPQGPASINVTLSACDQNLTGNTFVNVSAAGALTPTATGNAAATVTPTVTPLATLAAGNVGSTAAPTVTPIVTVAGVSVGTTVTPTVPPIVAVAGVSAGSTATTVGASQTPSGLPRAGESVPWGGPYALVIGVLLLVAGLVTRRLWA